MSKQKLTSEKTDNITKEKPKRTRRTKIEMEEYRAKLQKETENSINEEKPKPKRRTKAEIEADRIAQLQNEQANLIIEEQIQEQLKLDVNLDVNVGKQEKTKRKRRTKAEIEADRIAQLQEKKEVTVIVEKEEINKEIINFKTDDDEIEFKANNKIINNLLNNRNRQKNTVTSDSTFYKGKEELVIPFVPEHAYYTVGDKVRLFKEPQLNIDVDEETYEYLYAYKKHLFGKSGTIKSISFAAKTNYIIYHVIFPRDEEEMHCYHHYLEWVE